MGTIDSVPEVRDGSPVKCNGASKGFYVVGAEELPDEGGATIEDVIFWDARSKPRDTRVATVACHPEGRRIEDIVSRSRNSHPKHSPRSESGSRNLPGIARSKRRLDTLAEEALRQHRNGETSDRNIAPRRSSVRRALPHLLRIWLGRTSICWSLRFKKIGRLHSVRIGLRYRALGVERPIESFGCGPEATRTTTNCCLNPARGHRARQSSVTQSAPAARVAGSRTTTRNHPVPES